MKICAHEIILPRISTKFLKMIIRIRLLHSTEVKVTKVTVTEEIGFTHHTHICLYFPPYHCFFLKFFYYFFFYLNISALLAIHLFFLDTCFTTDNRVRIKKNTHPQNHQERRKHKSVLLALFDYL
jgi:hypothetical protein